MLVLLKDGREARDISGLKEEHHHSGGTFAEHQSWSGLVFFCTQLLIRKDATRFRSPRWALRAE